MLEYANSKKTHSKVTENEIRVHFFDDFHFEQFLGPILEGKSDLVT